MEADLPETGKKNRVKPRHSREQKRARKNEAYKPIPMDDLSLRLRQLQRHQQQLLASAQEFAFTGSVWTSCTHPRPDSDVLENGVKVVSETNVLVYPSHIKHQPHTNVTIHVKPLLILDLNGILCHRVRRVFSSTNNSSVPAPSLREPCGHVATTDVIARNDLKSFLVFLIQNFTLGVWSSATHKTVKQLKELLIPPEVAKRLLFVWSQSQCDKQRTNRQHQNKSKTTGESIDEFEKQFVFCKHLNKVFAQFQLWNEENTLMLDDSPNKFNLRSSPNVVHPPPLNGLKSTNSQSLSDDEINEKRQRIFFEQLVRAWSQPHAESFSLQKFLKAHAADLF